MFVKQHNKELLLSRYKSILPLFRYEYSRSGIEKIVERYGFPSPLGGCFCVPAHDLVHADFNPVPDLTIKVTGIRVCFKLMQRGSTDNYFYEVEEVSPDEYTDEVRYIAFACRHNSRRIS